MDKKRMKMLTVLLDVEDYQAVADEAERQGLDMTKLVRLQAKRYKAAAKRRAAL